MRGLPKSNLERAATHFNVPLEEVTPEMVSHVEGIPRGSGLESSVSEIEIDGVKVRTTVEKTREAEKNKEILLDVLEHQVLGSGRVINAARAMATPCKCFTYDTGEMCWSPGVLGLMSSKKNPEQIAQFCAIGKTPASEGVKERFEKVKGAIESAHSQWQKEGGDLQNWWHKVAESLEKREIEL